MRGVNIFSDDDDDDGCGSGAICTHTFLMNAQIQQRIV